MRIAQTSTRFGSYKQEHVKDKMARKYDITYLYVCKAISSVDSRETKQ
jgi:hypothetical protein